MQTLHDGQQFGSWRVTHTATGGCAQKVLVQCNCGVESSVVAYSLVSGGSTQCMKCAREASKKARLRALEYEWRLPARFPLEYRVWAGMLNRCHGVKPHKDYGGRGIRVCARWRAEFVFFLQDMGVRPSSDYSLDRVNSDGNYEPTNCRWSTKAEQAQNRRDNAGDDADAYKQVRAARRELATWTLYFSWNSEAISRLFERLGEALCAYHGLEMRSASSASSALESF
jgi:hypothetical protein